MDDPEDTMSSDDLRSASDTSSGTVKPRKRSLVERELETSLTERFTSPITNGVGLTKSRYGRARRLKTNSSFTDTDKAVTQVLKSPNSSKLPLKPQSQSPAYKMHASNSPVKKESPNMTVQGILENQIEKIYNENISLSRFGSEEKKTGSPSPVKKFTKVYTRKDLIQNKEKEVTVRLIRNIFTPVKSTPSPVKSGHKPSNSHLSNVLERSSEKYNINENVSTKPQNGYIENSSVVKTLDFDGNKKKRKQSRDVKPFLSKSELFDLEAKCPFQVGDLAWARMGTFPFWPCIVTREPTSEMFVRKKLFGLKERDIIHVTFFGDNGRRSWVLDSMLRPFQGLLEFETARDQFTPEAKKKDPRLYAAFFISEKKQALWHTSVAEAESLMREPKRFRIDSFYELLEKSKQIKVTPKNQKSGKITRTDSDVSLSESLYDTLFSEDDGKTDDMERSRNKTRNKSLDVSEVVTACLDNMAAKTGITKIQRQSHMDRWLQKAKSKTPEKNQLKITVTVERMDKETDTKGTEKECKTGDAKESNIKRTHKECKPGDSKECYTKRTQKGSKSSDSKKKRKSMSKEVKSTPSPYSFRKSVRESQNLLPHQNEHDYSKKSADDARSCDKSSSNNDVSLSQNDISQESATFTEESATFTDELDNSISVMEKVESLGEMFIDKSKQAADEIALEKVIKGKEVEGINEIKLCMITEQSMEVEENKIEQVTQSTEADKNTKVEENMEVEENTIEQETQDTDSEKNIEVTENNEIEESKLEQKTENEEPEKSNEVEESMKVKNVEIEVSQQLVEGKIEQEIENEEPEKSKEVEESMEIKKVEVKVSQEIVESKIDRVTENKEPKKSKEVVKSIKVKKNKEVVEGKNAGHNRTLRSRKKEENKAVEYSPGVIEEQKSKTVEINEILEERKHKREFKKNTHQFYEIKVNVAEVIENDKNKKRPDHEHLVIENKSDISSSNLDIEDDKSIAEQDGEVLSLSAVDENENEELINKDVEETKEEPKNDVDDEKEEAAVNVNRNTTSNDEQSQILKSDVVIESKNNIKASNSEINDKSEYEIESEVTSDVILSEKGNGNVEQYANNSANMNFPTTVELDTISIDSNVSNADSSESEYEHLKILYSSLSTETKPIEEKSIEKNINLNCDTMSIPVSETKYVDLNSIEVKFPEIRQQMCNDTESNRDNGLADKTRVHESDMSVDEDVMDCENPNVSIRTDVQDKKIALVVVNKSEIDEFIKLKTSNVDCEDHDVISKDTQNKERVNIACKLNSEIASSDDFTDSSVVTQCTVTNTNLTINESKIMNPVPDTEDINKSKKPSIKVDTMESITTSTKVETRSTAVCDKDVIESNKNTRSEVETDIKIPLQDTFLPKEPKTEQNLNPSDETANAIKADDDYYSDYEFSDDDIEQPAYSPHIPEPKDNDNEITEQKPVIAQNVDSSLQKDDLETTSVNSLLDSDMLKTQMLPKIENIQSVSTHVEKEMSEVKTESDNDSMTSELDNVSLIELRKAMKTKNRALYLIKSKNTNEVSKRELRPRTSKSPTNSLTESAIIENGIHMSKDTGHQQDKECDTISLISVDSEDSISSIRRQERQCSLENKQHPELLKYPELELDNYSMSSELYNVSLSELRKAIKAKNRGLLSLKKSSNTNEVSKRELRPRTSKSPTNSLTESALIENGIHRSKDIDHQQEKECDTISLISVGSEDSNSSVRRRGRKEQQCSLENKRHPEFLKYLESQQDDLMNDHPELTYEEIVAYLFRTWKYNKNKKSDDIKTEDIKSEDIESKDVNQDPILPKIKNVLKQKKLIDIVKVMGKDLVGDNNMDVKAREKRKTQTVQPFYKEDFSDLEDEIEVFEIFRKKPEQHKNDQSSKIDTPKVTTTEPPKADTKPSATTSEVSGDKLVAIDKPGDTEIQEEYYDEIEAYFEDLTKPKPNLFKGLNREKVCEICEKPSNLIKCKGCHGMYHHECAIKLYDVKVEPPPIPRGRKKKKKTRGRKPKVSTDSNGVDSESQSDEKSHDLNNSEELNMSVDEVTDEPENLVVDADDLEAEFETKMKEFIKNEVIYISDSDIDEKINWDQTVAGKCEIVDVKIKLKPPKMEADYSDFKCKFCLEDEIPRCFVCKSNVSPKDKSVNRQKCQVAHCHKYYHLSCLDHWPQTRFNSGEPSRNNKKISEHFEALTCPRHVCHTCVCDDPRGCKTRFSGDKLARCVRCPATYHSFTKCLPAGSQVLTASHIICPRHYEHKGAKGACHVNTGWCFICALGGSLICCEYCPTSFHADCLNIEPPEGGYMCEDCETGRLPLYGEMVWVKLGHYRWWPGIILHPSEIPENILAVKHSLGEFVVRFFGQYDHYWVNRGRVFPFQEGDTGRVSGQKSKIDEAFTLAIEHAQRAFEMMKNVEANEEEDPDIASSLLPPHYVKLKVNKPCGSLYGKRVDTEESSLTPCDCDPDVEDPCGPYSHCLNRMLLTECGPTCRAGERCLNRAFEKRRYPRLVPYRTQHRGWGLKTLEDIKSGQFVIEYVGELIDEEEFKRRMRRKHEMRDENYYFLTLDKERMIDAGPKGNLARFMNHCCEPNCETQKWTVLGDIRVGLFALKDIPANSEVTFNYNLECAGIEKKQCMCGAKRCSGFMGAKPKQDEPQTKKPKDAAKRTKKRKPEESPNTSQSKPKRPVGRPAKPRELTEIEKDLLIIKNATNGISSDSECSGRVSSIESDAKGLKRKRVSFSSEEMYNGASSPSVKKIKLDDEKESEVVL